MISLDTFIEIDSRGHSGADQMGVVEVSSKNTATRSEMQLHVDDDCEEGNFPSQPIAISALGAEGLFSFDVVTIKRTFIERPPPRGAHSFSETFPDLMQATKGRREMDLTTLASQVYAEAGKGDEAFEAFGVKFPSEQVTRWGMILLSGVQLYLLMYLRRLSNKLTSDDPGWDVPWMAMDQSYFARAMLLCSMLLLPVAAASMIVIRSAIQILGENWSWQAINMLRNIDKPDRFELLLIVMGFCANVTLSGLCWKYRPKLSEPVAPAQLFE